MSTKWTYTLGLLCLVASAFAQDSAQIAQEIIDLGSRFQQAESYFIEQHIRIVENGTDEALEQTEAITYKASGHYFSKRLNEELIISDGHVLQVFHDDQEIRISSAAGTSAPELDLSQFFQFYSDLRKRTASGQLVYTLYFKEQYKYRKVELRTSPEGQVMGVRIYPRTPFYRQGEEIWGSIDISYDRVVMNKAPNEQVRTASDYLVIHQGDATGLKPDYQHYTLISNLN